MGSLPRAEPHFLLLLRFAAVALFYGSFIDLLLNSILESDTKPVCPCKEEGGCPRAGTRTPRERRLG